MSTVLGLSFYYHDSAAALVRDGEIVAAVAEERLSRRKHTSEFPKLSIEYCLEAAGLRSINDLDAIVFYEKPLVKFMRILEVMVATWPRSYAPFVMNLPRYLQDKLDIRKTIRKYYPTYEGRILFSEHHLSHAASAFFPSPYEEAAILTLDGVGEWDTTCVGYGNRFSIQLDETLHFPHSIGMLYSALTAYLGFKVNDGEWKVMGLAPYGEPKYVENFRKLVDVRDDGSFQLNMEYFAHHWSNKVPFQEERWRELFGFGARRSDEELAQQHSDLARSGQAVVEELILGIARHAKDRYKVDNLVIAGGVGLNSVANWKIEQQRIFKNVWIQPAAGDDGGALGAALYISHAIFEDRRETMRHTYYGPEFTDEEIEEFLEERGVPFEKLEHDALVARAADCVAQGQVIGWFQGRCEFGPRSLGNRSIVADPTRLDMKEIINAKIKFREWFRPFAPSILLESVHEYFEVPPGTEFPFMLKIPSVREEMKAKLPAITHADGTGRLQTVDRSLNPEYCDLLDAVKERIGVPVVVNTSFNVRGEPIVCTPEDAYNCFIKTGIDTLFLGSYVVAEKEGAVDADRGYKESDELERQIAGESQPELRTSRDEAVEVSRGFIDSRDPSKVLAFYKTLPFNVYSSATDASLALFKKNQVKGYSDLHRIFESRNDLDVLDVGCGGGWFANSCVIYYPHRVHAIDFNPKAIRQAVAVSRLGPDPERVRFEVADVFAFQPGRSFDVVNSLGVLHHTADCHGAIRRAASWLRDGGYLHLGLYHSYSRRPFLDHFKRMQEAGRSIAEMFDEFRKLRFGLTDDVHLYSWFRDQVLHPNETQHSYEEISALLEGEGLEIRSTSINDYKPLPSLTELIAMEKKMAGRAQRKLERGYYVPGFFTILARKPQVKQR
ncbi:MAG TPA: carbamoyltransferase N-terminal domain-containing protein [Thermoanaerobaculia bacterium]|nr:carbamoyltransferase N-terminal domain-containing protein [Thermoanaerobaculia bacterium]